MVADPRVSFLMPVYDGEAFVADAIESVREQTADCWELVVIDDGSTDDSADVVESFLPDDRIRFFGQENRGVTATTNRAMRLADGEFLAVHPQDDVSVPDRLERQLAVFEDHPDVGMVYSPATFVDFEGEAFNEWGGWHGEGRVPGEELFRELYVGGMCLASPSVLFRSHPGIDEEEPWGDPALTVVSDWEHWMHAAQHYDAYELEEPVVRMLRDADHSHLGGRHDVIATEERIVLRRIRRQYAEGTPPVTRRMYAAATSNHSLRRLRHQLYEQRDYLGGLRSSLRAFCYNPLNRELYAEYVTILRSLV